MFSKVKKLPTIRLMQSTIILSLLRLNINETGRFVFSLIWDLRIMIGTISYENFQNKYFFIANIFKFYY
jgi:hypothetical protein